MKGTTFLTHMSCVAHVMAPIMISPPFCIAWWMGWLTGSSYNSLPNLNHSYVPLLRICFGRYPDGWMWTWYALDSSQRILSQSSTVVIITAVGYDYSERNFVHIIVLKQSLKLYLWHFSSYIPERGNLSVSPPSSVWSLTMTKIDYVWVRKQLRIMFHVPDSTTAQTLDLGLYTLYHCTYKTTQNILLQTNRSNRFVTSVFVGLCWSMSVVTCSDNSEFIL